MRRFAKITAALLAAAILCGCEKIPDKSDSEPESLESANSQTESAGSGLKDSYAPGEHTVVAQSFTKKYEAEKGAFNGRAYDESGKELQNPDKGGYVRLQKNQYLTQVAMVTSSQFYRVVVSVRSESGAALKLQLGDNVEGAYTVSKTVSEESGGNDYKLYAVDHLYMSAGMNSIKFICENGEADIDCVVVENSEAVDEANYKVGSACAAKNASSRATQLMMTLSEYYGKLSFTAQNVSCGSNAEIDAVYGETKRYPAIRVSELSLALKDDEHSKEVMKNDLDLAKAWDKDGGICAYTWHWYSPNALRGTELKLFDAESALEKSDPEEMGMLDDESMELQLENGFITQDGAAILKDLDTLAETLKTLDDADIPILFEPIPDGDAGLFWWGKSAESYKTLWRLTFVRLTQYHGLKNLIWVWNNSDFDYYPGDDQVDIIGQSFYEKTNSSFAGQFAAIAENNASGRKMLAVTACASLPSVDFMWRDNAMWLWTAPDCGEYVLDNEGGEVKLTEKYTKRAAFRNVYNNEKCVTRDELSALGY